MKFVMCEQGFSYIYHQYRCLQAQHANLGRLNKERDGILGGYSD